MDLSSSTSHSRPRRSCSPALDAARSGRRCASAVLTFSVLPRPLSPFGMINYAVVEGTEQGFASVWWAAGQGAVSGLFRRRNFAAAPGKSGRPLSCGASRRRSNADRPSDGKIRRDDPNRRSFGPAGHTAAASAELPRDRVQLGELRLRMRSPAPATFSRRCATDEVPGISRMSRSAAAARRARRPSVWRRDVRQPTRACRTAAARSRLAGSRGHMRCPVPRVSRSVIVSTVGDVVEVLNAYDRRNRLGLLDLLSGDGAEAEVLDKTLLLELDQRREWLRD